MKNNIITKKNKKKAEPHFNKAQQLKRRKNYKEAEEELIIVVKLVPSDKNAHYGLGEIYYLQGSYKSAMESLKKALELDGNFEEAQKLEDLILAEVEKKKPKWIKEDKYYTKARLVFEDFNEEAILPKFVAVDGEFTIEKDGEKGYGKWKIKGAKLGEDEEDLPKKQQILKTAIRLPDMSKFNGVLISFKSSDFKGMEMVLIEQTVRDQNKWSLVVSGIEKEWKDLKIPFHYFQLPGNPTAGIDRARISQIQFVLEGDKKGELFIDNFELYQ